MQVVVFFLSGKNDKNEYRNDERDGGKFLV